jgi:hypothetical protein
MTIQPKAIQESLTNAVWVLLGVCVPVMSSVVTAPLANRPLNSTTTHSSKENFEWESGQVGLVGPQTVVAGSNSKTSPKVVYESRDGG